MFYFCFKEKVLVRLKTMFSGVFLFALFCFLQKKSCIIYSKMNIYEYMQIYSFEVEVHRLHFLPFSDCMC